jgi:hypothetical protein
VAVARAVTALPQPTPGREWRLALGARLLEDAAQIRAKAERRRRWRSWFTVLALTASAAVVGVCVHLAPLR